MKKKKDLFVTRINKASSLDIKNIPTYIIDILASRYNISRDMLFLHELSVNTNSGTYSSTRLFDILLCGELFYHVNVNIQDLLIRKTIVLIFKEV